MLYDFLSCKKLYDSPYDCAVVEGWISDSQIRQAAGLIMEKAISTIIVTGSVMEFCSEYMPADNYAEIGALRLVKAGIPVKNIIVSVGEDNKMFRTYKCALRVRDTLCGLPYRHVLIFTSAPHARRTFAIYRRVLGSDYDIGIFPLEINGISNDNWWKSSAGVKSVIEEYIGIFVYCIYGKAKIL